MKNLDGLSDEHALWIPPRCSNCVQWLLWHIAEVEDNWVREVVLGREREFPMGVSVRDVAHGRYPGMARLIDYLDNVRAQSHARLEATTTADFERIVQDPTFGSITVRDVWAGVVTSFAWHAGQIALINRLMPRE